MDSSVHLALKRQNREAKKSQPGLRGTAGTHAFTSHGHLTATGTDLSLEAGLCLARCEFKGWDMDFPVQKLEESIAAVGLFLGI